MSLLRIVKVEEEDPVLRTEAKPIRRIDAKWRALLDDMLETMRDAPGVGLAAPQVGVGRRLIVVEVPEDPEQGHEGPTRVHRLADPEIVWRSESTHEDQEACLSIPGLYGDVSRHVRIRVRAIDYSGRRVELDLEDFEARVFQHEIDHLDGILFTDRVASLEKLYRIEETEDGEFVKVPLETSVAPEKTGTHPG